MAADAEFSFVDAHHHAWDLSNLYYAWLTDRFYEGHPVGDYRPIMKNYLISDLKRDGASVNLVKSVHIETCDGETDTVKETAWLQQVADAEGMPNGIIARVDLCSPDAARELDRHRAFANFRGVRMLSFMGLDFLESPDFIRGFDALQQRDLIYDMDAGWPQMGQARRLADRFPRSTIILGHCGFPKQRTAEYFHSWRKALKELAGAPNVACKISGLAMVDHHWTVDSIRPWVETCIEAFGVGRCIFATNWPVDSLYSDYPTVVNAYREIVRGLDPADQRKLFRENAEGYYRI
jgi:predicted TIM-barrel fold metal-dependent hydrolase